MALPYEESLAERAGAATRGVIGAGVNSLVTAGEDVGRTVGTIVSPVARFGKGLFGVRPDQPTPAPSTPAPRAGAVRKPTPGFEDFSQGSTYPSRTQGGASTVGFMPRPAQANVSDATPIDTTSIRGGSRGINFSGSTGTPSGAGAPEPQVRGWVQDSSGRNVYDTTPVPAGGFVTDLGGPTGDMTIPEMLAAGARQRTANRAATAGALERGANYRAQLSEEGQTARAAGAQEGAMKRMLGEIAGKEYSASMARSAERPLRSAQARLTGAQAGVAETAAEEAQLKTRLLERLGDVKYQRENPVAYENLKNYYNQQFGKKPVDSAERAAYIRQGINPDTMQPLEGFAEGGLIEGYAGGGAIGAAPTLHPAIAQYGQYLQAATASGVPPISFDQFSSLQSGAGPKPNAGATPMPMTPPGVPGFAGGGAIPVAGKLLKGPGTGTSDSIPAVIDGHRPAGLSSGEFVIPEKVVRAKGTEFFEKLIAQYAEGAENGK